MCRVAGVSLQAAGSNWTEAIGMLKSIEDEWNEFATCIFSKMYVSKTQRAETEKAFYAGAFVLLKQLEEIGESGVSENQGIAHLDSIKHELLTFHRNIIRKARESN